MLAAAPWSLVVFTLTLPFALIAPAFYGTLAWVTLALAAVNLIAFARTTFAWHRVAVLGTAPDVGAARGGSGEARHLVLLGLIAIGLTALARATGDLPYVIYMLLGGANEPLFYGVLIASLVVLWAPVLRAVAMYGLCLPNAAVKGEYAFQAMRAAMRYRRWPLMAALFALLVLGAQTAGQLWPLAYAFTGLGLAQGAVAVLGCVAMTFVLTTMFAVAYRDSAA
ncbi:hypothetical protein KYC_24687 [Achromobacter arsenitoxydans SY8]|uniref:Uncharacterized protein n=2 Tax=Achromobacter TaxID=222 RepID=H0FDS7_9BURK|nr:hypothetical protein KYC_24687 [Achromobacter arsenitoxydans SY8]